MYSTVLGNFYILGYCNCCISIATELPQKINSSCYGMLIVSYIFSWLQWELNLNCKMFSLEIIIVPVGVCGYKLLLSTGGYIYLMEWPQTRFHTNSQITFTIGQILHVPLANTRWRHSSYEIKVCCLVNSPPNKGARHIPVAHDLRE